MRTLVTKSNKCMLWKDELYDVKDSTKHTFLLLKYAEVYQSGKKTLRLHIWNPQKLSSMRKMGLILNEIRLDEGFTIADVEIANLPTLIALGAFKKRPRLRGRWLSSKRRLLGHDIMPYRGKVKEVLGE